MDEFLRPATHELVTGALLVIWSGLLLGLIWKTLSLIWGAALRLVSQPATAISVIFFSPERPELPRAEDPLLGEAHPGARLDGKPQPLLPGPQATPFLIPFFHSHKENTSR